MNMNKMSHFMRARTLCLSRAVGLIMIVCSFGKAHQACAAYWDGLPGVQLAIEGASLYGPLAAKDGDIYGLSDWPWGELENALVRWCRCGGGWQIIGQVAAGTGQRLMAIFVKDNYLYAGGYFTNISGITATNIAKYDMTSGVWSPVGDGSHANPVSSIVVDSNNRVYVGCYAPGVDANQPAPEILKVWNGSAWATVGGTDCLKLANGDATWGVTALGTDGVKIYIGGGFSGTLSTTSPLAIIWDTATSQWRGITWREAIFWGPDPKINSVAANIAAGILYVTGQFHTPTWSINGFARFDISSGLQADDDQQYGLLQDGGLTSGSGHGVVVAPDGFIYLAGEFDSVGTILSPSAFINGIAKLGSTGWEPLGTGLTWSGLPATGLTIAADQYGMYVSGAFSEAGGIGAGSGVARYMMATLPGCTNISPLPVGWWPLDKDGFDLLGMNPGEAMGNHTWIRGKVCQGISLNGNQSGISIANNPNGSLNFGPGADFSIEAWVKPTGGNQGVMSIFDKRQAPDVYHAQGIRMYLQGYRLYFEMNDVYGSPALTVGPAGPDFADAWHHVVVTVQRNSTGGIKMWIDGNFWRVGNPTSKPGDLGNAEPLLIGMHPTPGVSGNFMGVLDEVTLYNRVLSFTEIRNIFLAGSQGKCR